MFVKCMKKQYLTGTTKKDRNKFVSSILAMCCIRSKQAPKWRLTQSYHENMDTCRSNMSDRANRTLSSEREQ